MLLLPRFAAKGKLAAMVRVTTTFALLIPTAAGGPVRGVVR